MPYILGAFSLFCAQIGATGSYDAACNKALEATAKQSGTYQLLDKAERRTADYAAEVGNDKLGKTTMDVGGAAVFLYRTYRDKSLNFKLPNLGIADSITNQVTTNSYKLNLKWNLY